MRRGCITVVGLPMPQGSKTAFVVKGRAVLTDGRNKQARSNFAAWRNAVAWQASEWCKKQTMPAPIDGPVEVTIDFFLPRPASLPKRILEHVRKPDVDKLARAVLDALTGIVYTDDARIFSLSAGKHYATNRPPGATITWRELDERTSPHV